MATAEPTAAQQPGPAPPAHTQPEQPESRSAQEEEGHQEAGQSQDHPTAPASPPLPTPHKPVAPGPRAAALQQAFDRALSQTLAKLEWDKFAACYPTISTRAPNSLRSVQQRVVGLLSEKCRKEFELVLEEREVVPKLNELESLVSEASRRRKEAAETGGASSQPGVPPHLLPPEDVLAAHLAARLASQQSQLNAKLQTTQALNSALFDEIQGQRREAEQLIAELESICADISGAHTQLGEVADELARETRQSEVEMGGV